MAKRFFVITKWSRYSSFHNIKLIGGTGYFAERRISLRTFRERIWNLIQVHKEEGTPLGIKFKSWRRANNRLFEKKR